MIPTVDHFAPTTSHREWVKGCRVMTHTYLLGSLQVAWESLCEAELSKVLARLLRLLKAHLRQWCVNSLSCNGDKVQT